MTVERDAVLARRRPRNLAVHIVDELSSRIRSGALAPGAKLPSEAMIMEQFGVSRTVVREALSKLQAGRLVTTRHGIGTFVVGFGDATPFRISAEQLATLDDVISVLELRMGVETEAAALAAARRSANDLASMRGALDTFAAATSRGEDAVEADFRFHLEIARATRNARYCDLMASFGTAIIPRARLEADAPMSEERREYLRRLIGEHESIFEAIAARDSDGARAAMRTHLANSRERRRRAAAAARKR